MTWIIHRCNSISGKHGSNAYGSKDLLFSDAVPYYAILFAKILLRIEFL